MSAQGRPEPGYKAPDGFEFAAARDPGWRIELGRRCRDGASGPNRRACGKPSVAGIRRGIRRPQWWAYCEDHLSGRWIEDGKVMHWDLRRVDDDGGVQ